jgi:hypothetical protein
MFGKMMDGGHENMLYSVYDFKVCEPTFDVLKHLYSAEMYRLKHGFPSLHIIFALCDTDSGFHQFSTDLYSVEHCEWRLKNICLAATSLLPKASISICRRPLLAKLLEGASAVHPPGYTLEEPITANLLRQSIIQWMAGSPLPAMQASKTAHGLIAAWLKENASGKPVITVTLRRTKYANTMRNSRLDAWGAFVQSLKEKYCVIFLDDFDFVFDRPPPGFEDCKTLPSTMFSIELRSSLYQHAMLNLLVGNGPMALCTTNCYCRFLIFMNFDEQDKAQNYTTSLSQALRRGGDIRSSWFTPFQRYIWGEESFELIRESFDQMIELIESKKFRSRAAVFEFIEENRLSLIESDSLQETIKELVGLGTGFAALSIARDVLRFGDGFQKDKFKYIEGAVIDMLRSSGVWAEAKGHENP